MRRSCFAVVVLVASPVLMIACGSDPPPPAAAPAAVAPPPPPPEPDAPEPPKPTLAQLEKQAIGEALQGLNGQDARKFAAVYADDAVISVAGLQEVSGRAAIEGNMSEWFETFKDVKLGFSRVWSKNDKLVLEWVINGKHHGELFGVKGTEQPIGHYGLSFVTMSADGKVATEHRYGELGTVMTQVGGAGAKAKARPIPTIPAEPETVIALTAPTPEEDKNVEIGKSVLASLESGKKDTDFLNLLSDDVEQDGLLHLEMSKGKDGAKKFHKAFTTAFPDAKFETTQTLAIGDYALIESVLRATNKGPLGSIQATKKPIEIHVADIFRIKDGKVTRAWTYQNGLELQQQLGLLNFPSSSAPASQTMAAAPKPVAAKDSGGGGGKGTGGGGGGGKGTGGGHDKK